MTQWKTKKALVNEEGSGLVLVLMVLLVLSVLGASLGVVTIGSLELSTINRDTNSAYYIAEAGTNLAYEEFEENIKRLNENPTIDSKQLFFSRLEEEIKKNGEKYNTSYGAGAFSGQFGHQPKAKVKIQKSAKNEKSYIIVSTGDIGGRKRTVRKEVILNWQPKGSFGFPENAAMIARKKIEIDKGSVTGDLYLENTSNEDIDIEGKIYGDIHIINGKDYELEIEEGGEINGNIYINNVKEKLEIEIDESAKINGNIYTGNVKELKITGEGIFSGKKIEREYAGNSKGWETNFGKVDSYVAGLVEERKTIENPIENIPYLKYKDVEYEDENLDLKLYGDTKVKKFELENGEHRIDIGNNNITLFMKELILENANLEIEGEGMLTIVVSEEAEFDENSTFNLDQKNVRIISTGEEIDIKKGSTVYAQFIAPFSELTIENKHSVVNGNIIAKKIEVKNGGSFIFNSFNFDNKDLIQAGPIFE